VDGSSYEERVVVRLAYNVDEHEQAGAAGAVRMFGDGGVKADIRFKSGDAYVFGTPKGGGRALSARSSTTR
jgi:hypothetical protein